MKIRRWLSEHGIYWSHGERRWHLWWCGAQFGFEVGRVSGSRWAEVRFGRGGSAEGMQLTAGFGWGAWLTIRPPWSVLRLRIVPSGERVFGFNWSHGTAHISIFHDHWRDMTQGRTPGRFKVWDNLWIVGRDSHELREYMTTTGIVRCGEWPGDEYPVEVTLEERTWRNRFRTMRRVSYAMRVPDGGTAPPFPGNGENSWDLGEDGIYAMGADAECGSVEAALAKYAEATIRNRRRYGGKNWRPVALTEALP